MILFIINTLRLVSALYERKSDQKMHRAVQYQSTTQHVHWKQIVFQNLPIYLLASLPKVLQSFLTEVPDAHLQASKSFFQMAETSILTIGCFHHSISLAKYLTHT